MNEAQIIRDRITRLLSRASSYGARAIQLSIVSDQLIGITCNDADDIAALAERVGRAEEECASMALTKFSMLRESKDILENLNNTKISLNESRGMVENQRVALRCSVRREEDLKAANTDLLDQRDRLVRALDQKKKEKKHWNEEAIAMSESRDAISDRLKLAMEEKDEQWNLARQAKAELSSARSAFSALQQENKNLQQGMEDQRQRANANADKLSVELALNKQFTSTIDKQQIEINKLSASMGPIPAGFSTDKERARYGNESDIDFIRRLADRPSWKQHRERLFRISRVYGAATSSAAAARDSATKLRDSEQLVIRLHSQQDRYNREIDSYKAATKQIRGELKLACDEKDRLERIAKVYGPTDCVESGYQEPLGEHRPAVSHVCDRCVFKDTNCKICLHRTTKPGFVRANDRVVVNTESGSFGINPDDIQYLEASFGSTKDSPLTTIVFKGGSKVAAPIDMRHLDAILTEVANS